MVAALQTRIRIVQSPANRWVKALRAARAHPPALAPEPYALGEAPLLVLEGFHLVVEALRSGLIPAAIFLRSGQDGDALRTLAQALARHETAHPVQTSETIHSSAALHVPNALRMLQTTELLTLPPALFSTLVETESPQPIAALVPAPSFSPVALFTAQSSAEGQGFSNQGNMRLSQDRFNGVQATRPRAAPLLLVLAALQDPGNVGTLLRSAEAFGATGALLLAGTATPWSSKSLRASAGSALRLPLVAMRHAGEAAVLLRRHGIRSYAAVPEGGVDVQSVPLNGASALWIGNEGAGLGERELQACDAPVTLAMQGPAESLNAAVAGSLLLYEASRQRAAASLVRIAPKPADVAPQHAGKAWEPSGR